jgi:hypothetical protein
MSVKQFVRVVLNEIARQLSGEYERRDERSAGASNLTLAAPGLYPKAASELQVGDNGRRESRVAEKQRLSFRS